MAVPADVDVKRQWAEGGVEALPQIVATLNQVVATLRLLTAKLDADAGVTDADYDASLTDGAVASAPAELNVI